MPSRTGKATTKNQTNMPGQNAMTDKMLKAVSHPLRRRILRLLDLDKHSRATDLAAQLGVTTSLASFHLRSLAAAGLIVEAPELARDSRDRVWRPTSPALSIPIDSTPNHQSQTLTSDAIAAFIGDHQALLARVVEDAITPHRDDSAEHTGALVSLSLRGTRQELERFFSDMVSAASRITDEADPDDTLTQDWEISLIAAHELPADRP